METQCSPLEDFRVSRFMTTTPAIIRWLISIKSTSERIIQKFDSVRLTEFFHVHFRNITSIGFHENGKFMFTGSEDCRVRIWDNNSAQHTCKRVFDCLSPVLAVCLHPNQVELAIATSNASIFLWNISNDYNEQLLPESNNSIKLSSKQTLISWKKH